MGGGVGVSAGDGVDVVVVDVVDEDDVDGSPGEGVVEGAGAWHSGEAGSVTQTSSAWALCPVGSL